jgi:hypothetical protein
LVGFTPVQPISAFDPLDIRPAAAELGFQRLEPDFDTSLQFDESNL